MVHSDSAEAPAVAEPRSRSVASNGSATGLAIVLLGLAAAIAAAVYAAAPGPAQARLLSAEEIAENYCVPIAAGARVSASEPADHALRVDVPLETPAGVASPHGAVAISRGDIVAVAVKSPRAGAVGVHGLSDIHPMEANDTIQLSFRAIYQGRFALHFHGTDGSHFELLALEVL